MSVTRKIGRYEEIRLKNIEDNKAVLNKLMEGMDELVKTPVKRTPRHKREKISFPVRWNPSRSCRSVPRDNVIRRRSSRKSSSSLSSSFLSTPSSLGQIVVKFGSFQKPYHRTNNDKDNISGSNSDCEGVSVYEEDDDGSGSSSDEDIKPLRASRSRNVAPREMREITEEDLKRVADVFSHKRYDSEFGTSCHQCRQKTDDMKTICHSSSCVGVRGQFCGPCLRIRYGEDARESLKNPEWVCPPCRGICNCSFCRRHAGMSSTGILIHAAREYGFKDCKSYLERDVNETLHPKTETRSSRLYSFTTRPRRPAVSRDRDVLKHARRLRLHP